MRLTRHEEHGLSLHFHLDGFFRDICRKSWIGSRQAAQLLFPAHICGGCGLTDV